MPLRHCHCGITHNKPNSSVSVCVKVLQIKATSSNIAQAFAHTTQSLSDLTFVQWIHVTRTEKEVRVTEKNWKIRKIFAIFYQTADLPECKAVSKQ